jgi:DNA-directed RNA polymerase subunit M/transcription elongation factor TFIIS
MIIFNNYLFIKMANTSNASNKHEIRNKYREMLMNDIELTELEAVDLEIGVFNATIDYANSLKIPLSWSSDLFIDSYLNIARSIYSNLDKNSYIGNIDLIEKLKSRQILPNKLPYMSCEDMFPEKWVDIKEKQKLKFKAAYEIKQVSMTDTIKCGKCKNNKISYYELQTRSGDEAITQFYNCIICGHKWKN